MRFEHWGKSGGSLLFCLHGFMGTGLDWHEFAERFLAIVPDWQVAAPDLHSFDGRCPTLSEIRDCLEHHAAECNAPKTLLMGYSMGGRLALEITLDAPAAFSGFIGVSTTAGIENSKEREERRLSDLGLAARLRAMASRDEFQNFLRSWWEQPVFHSPRNDQSALEKFISTRLDLSPARLAASLDAWSVGVLSDQWSRLENLNLPVLLLAGECDKKYSALARRMAADLPMASARIIPGTGHRLPAEAPQELAVDIAAFIEKLPI
jgi:2-succinyl-6-hydroxy-2,4-cyclohexadiene-1-carboxylate synthase